MGFKGTEFSRYQYYHRLRKSRELGIPFDQVKVRDDKSRVPRGKNHYRWNQGRLLGNDGYIKIRIGKSHPLADSSGKAFEHWVVWCSAGNPPPASDEILHHKNGDKSDNRLENLELMKRYDHSVMHFSKMTDDDIRKARTLYATGECDMPAIAVHFGVPVARVSKIIRGETRIAAGGPISTNNRGRKHSGRLLDGVEVCEVPDLTTKGSD